MCSYSRYVIICYKICRYVIKFVFTYKHQNFKKFLLQPVRKNLDYLTGWLQYKKLIHIKECLSALKVWHLNQ